MLARRSWRVAARSCTLRARPFSTAEWSGLEARAAKVMKELERTGETVSLAEWTSGGLISAALWVRLASISLSLGGPTPFVAA